MLVVFDWDGVLVDTVHKFAQCFEDSVRQVLPHAGAPAARRYFEANQGMPLEQITKDLFGNQWKRVFDRHLKNEKDIAANNRPFPGARKLIESLKADGHQVAVSTSFIHEIFSHRVEGAGLKDLFDPNLILGYEHGRGKAESIPELLKRSRGKASRFLRRLG